MENLGKPVEIYFRGKFKEMENKQALKVECFQEVSTKNDKYYSFYGQFDFCIIGRVNYFVGNSAGGALNVSSQNGPLSVIFEYDDIYYLSKTEAEEQLQPGVLLSIYGSNKLADWQNRKAIASYIEKIN